MATVMKTTRDVKGVGLSIPRPDGPEKVTGHVQYVADIAPRGLLHAKLLRSPHAHAKIVRIDVSKARALPGVRAVLTAADVPQLKEAFRNRDDIHNITAEELFGTVDRDTRGKAKTVNFAILYGVSAWGLASRMGVSREEGSAIIARYFERFPGIRAYMDDTLNFVRQNGYTKTLFGRKTHFYPNIRSPNPSIRGGAERAAINAPIQGTSADLIKRAMARMDDALAEAGLDGVRMLLQVHDELVFEVPDGREEEAAVVVRRVMESAAEPALKLDVPLDVEVGWGEHWGAAH